MAVQIREIPRNIDPSLRLFLQDVRAALIRLSPSVIPSGAVTNLKATGKSGGVIIEFTRSDADTYILYRNSTPQLDGSVIFDIGNSNRFVDDIGASGLKYYYWVKGKKGLIEGGTSGPVNATTLALVAEITPPDPLPGSSTPTRSDETGNVIPGRPTVSTYKKV